MVSPAQSQSKPAEKNAADTSRVIELARGAAESHEAIVSQYQAEIAELQAEVRRYAGIVENLSKLEQTVATQRISLQALIDCVPDNLWIKDSESRFVMANQATALRMGFAGSEELIGKSDLELCPPETAHDYFADEQEVIRSGRPLIDKEEYVIGGTGEMRWILTTKVPLRSDSGEVFGIVGISRDITDRKLAQTVANQRISLQALIDRVPDNLWIKDSESRFVMANQATALRMGYAGSEELIGKSDLELCPPETAHQYFADEQEVIRSGQPLIDKEEYVVGAAGEMRWILTTKVPLRNDEGEVFGIVGISRDITERREANQLRDGQAQILEEIATDVPLETVLDHLVLLVESQLPGVTGAVLLLDSGKDRFRIGSASNLPPGFAKAIECISVSGNAGSLGTAISRREPVIVGNLMKDALASKYSELAARQGYRSCWSIPIISQENRALGVLALYCRSLGEPTEPDLQLIGMFGRIAGIAIDRKLPKTTLGS